MKNKPIKLIGTGALTGIILAVLKLNGLPAQVTLSLVIGIILLILIVYLLINKKKRTLNKPTKLDRTKLFKERMVIAYYEILFVFPGGLTYFLVTNAYKT